MRLSGNALFFVYYGVLFSWYTFVIWLAVWTKDVGYITLFWLPLILAIVTGYVIAVWKKA